MAISAACASTEPHRARHGRPYPTALGVLHGGVITAMLDESCEMAVQLALDGPRTIATLDLRIDYQKPAMAGVDIRAHSVRTRVARSIAFVQSTAYQESLERAGRDCRRLLYVRREPGQHANRLAEGCRSGTNAGGSGGSRQARSHAVLASGCRMTAHG